MTLNQGDREIKKVSPIPNGNMIEDKNKGIDSIAYNHLNLPIKVEMNADGSNRIEYIYDAAGIKMAQLVYGADTLTKRIDYQGAFIYEDSVLQFIQHEEGRIVYETDVDGNFVEYEYQYHLKDHLGNVRATFKTEIDTDIYSTTLESDSASTEELYFYNLDSVRVTYASGNYTTGGDEAARVGQDSLHLVGPAIALSVVPGDTIDMEVWAYYEGGSGYSNTVTVNTFINALATAFGGSSGAAGESGSIFDGINDALVGGAGGVGGNSDTNVPGAYLSYILFDQNYKEIQSGYHEISSSASFAHEKLFLNDITISQAGYLYIYTSMQSKGTQPVYFDDMKVTHTHSPIVSKDDYYPFGLTFGSYARAASTGQNFKFGGKEEQQDWQVFDFEARMYDAALGRFNSIDPHADFYEMVSAYNYAFNNPMLFVDPTGMDNTVYLIVAGDMDTKEAQASADIANKYFEELGLETRVTVYDSEENGEFDAENLDETDNWAVIGEDRNDIVDAASKIDSEWTDHLEDGTKPWSSRNNPETSNTGKSGDKKGIVIDHKNNLNKNVKGLSATEGSAWSLMHGAGHSAKKIYEQRSNSGEYGHTNSGIMQGGNDMARDVRDHGKGNVTDPSNNQIYIEAIRERYGTNKSTDNYQKNKK